MRLKYKNLLQKFAATLKKFNAQGAKKVEYGTRESCQRAKNRIVMDFPVYI